jgi:hypothetical protein
MTSVGRTMAAVVAGCIAAVAIIMSVEFVSSKLYPPPPGIDFTNVAAITAWIGHLPLGAFLMVLAGWLAGAIAGAYAATAIARTNTAGYIVVALTFVSAIVNMLSIPHPMWFWVAAVAVFAVAGFVVSRKGAPRAAAAA